MASLKTYDRKLDYSYAPGLFTTVEALNNRPECVRRVLISTKIEDSALQTLIPLCQEKGVRMEQADKALSRISRKENCFAAAVFDKQQISLSNSENHIVLHNIQDKGNLGTILRTALGFNYLDIAIIRPAADCFDPKVVRASMGAYFSLRLREYDSFSEYQNEYSDRQLFPFILSGKISPEDAFKTAKKPHSLIFGNEASGLPKEFENIGTGVRIPHSDKIDSLNLAIATSIAMYVFSSLN